MENTGGKHGICFAFFDAVNQMLHIADAAGSDDGNIDRFADGAGQRQVEALFRAVPVHAGEQDFARAAPLHFNRPFDCVQARRRAPAVGKNFPAGVFGIDGFGIDGDDDGLRAEKSGGFVD